MAVDTSRKIKHAVEYHPLHSKQGILERLFTLVFDGFVYNQIWEDPRVDIEALQLDSTSRILTIASGGCNLLNYLIEGPEAVHAVDLNRHHIQFTTLKLTAVQYLPTHEALYDFYGFANKQSNLDNYYTFIKPHLDEEITSYWESGKAFQGKRIEYFTKNIYNYGAMATFIRIVHSVCRFYGVTPDKILHCNNQEQREKLFEEYYAPFFDRWLVKFVGRMPFLFYGLGIPPQQFAAMKEECGGLYEQLYRDRMKRLALQFPIEENYFAWQAFRRQYDHENRRAIPEYLKAEHYETIKSTMDRITLDYCSLTEYLKQQEDNSLNRYVFLDSQDWMDKETITELWTEVARTGQPGSRIIFRTASYESPIEEALPEDLRKRFVYEEDKSKAWFQQDRSAIYGGFHLYVLTD